MIERKRAIIYVAYDGDENILLEKRTNPNSKYYNQYIFPGGSVEEGENSPKAAEREILEETGLKTNGLALIDRFTKSFVGYPDYDFDVYLACPVEGELMDIEHKNFRGWFTFKEAEELIQEASSIGILQKAKAVLGKVK